MLAALAPRTGFNVRYLGLEAFEGWKKGKELVHGWIEMEIKAAEGARQMRDKDLGCRATVDFLHTCNLEAPHCF